jgi:transposase
MQRQKRSQVELSPRDRRALEELLRGGLQPVRTVRRGLALQGLAEGKPANHVAAGLGLAAKTVREIRDRYRQGGLERALYDKSRPGELVSSVGRETIRVLLQNHDLQPWREKNVVCRRSQ